MSRGNFKVYLENREDYDFEHDGTVGNCPDWLSSFAEEFAAKEAQKTVVDQVRERHSQLSIQDQINSIMNGVSAPYGSVEEAVADYQQRTGFSEYAKVAAAMEILDADDKDTEKKTPEIIERNPAIDVFIINLVDTNHGIQLPAILQSISENFRRDGIGDQQLTDPELARYISTKLKAIPQMEEMNLGKGVGLNDEEAGGSMDQNTNPFVNMMPHKSLT